MKDKTNHGLMPASLHRLAAVAAINQTKKNPVASMITDPNRMPIGPERLRIKNRKVAIKTNTQVSRYIAQYSLRVAVPVNSMYFLYRVKSKFFID